MQDRTQTISMAPHPVDNVHSVSAIIPMPGRLPVSYYDWDLHLGFDPSLDEVATGTLVNATGTITVVKHLTGGRAMAVISDTHGDSAHVLLNADIVRMVAPALYCGYQMNVRGIVTRTTNSQPAGIEADGVQVEVA